MIRIDEFLQLWAEWELFLPLHYDFVENGISAKDRYKEQDQETALIEYIPSSQRHDKSLGFFLTLSGRCCIAM